MEMYTSNRVDPVVLLKPPAKAGATEESPPVESQPAAPSIEGDVQVTRPTGDNSRIDIRNAALAEDIQRKLRAAMRGEMDFSLICPPPSDPASILKQNGIENPDEHNIEVFQNALSRGLTPEQAVSAVRSDPLVFDLNGDGDTNATVDQHGIEVDGATATKWAEKGDGVLAFKGGALDTVDSQGVKHKDAYETLEAEAQYLGIDTGKGHLDAADLQKLEANGLTMMVSNGDGTNQSMKPSELGITQMSLGGKAVDKTDEAGNLITTEGSFVRNGQTQLVNDMWLNSLVAPK